MAAAAAGLVVLGSLTAGVIVKEVRAREGRLATAQVQTGEVSGSQWMGSENGSAGDSLAGAGQTLSDSEENPEGAESAQGQSGSLLAEADTQAGPSGETDTQARSSGEAGSSGEEGSSEEEETSPRSSSDITMLFAGDVYFSDHVLNAYDSGGGISGVLDEGIRAEIEAADIFMVNQEFPFTVRGTKAEDKQFTFRVPQSRLHILKEMGVDIVTLANNHILDFGPQGLLDSCQALSEAGIPYVGGGKDFTEASALKTIIIGQKTIGFLATSRVYMDASWAAGKDHPGVFSTYDTTLPLKAIEEARDACDYLVVYVHWGVEREGTPKDYQKAMGRAYIDAGADLVVGSHPHVLQPIEEYKGKTIAYSLGNFVFGSSIPKTALLKVVWGEEGTQVSMIPCTSSAGYTRIEK